MWEIEEMKQYLSDNLLQNRYHHTLGVADTAIELAKNHDVNVKKAEIAALAHDIAKNMKVTALREIIDSENIKLTIDEENTQEIWHAIAGPIIAKRVFKIEDEEILSAMRWHTTGKANMTKLDKVVYLADLLEPSRNFPGIDELRAIAKVDLDLALESSLTHTIKYLVNKGFAIDINTINARNYLIYNKKKH